MSRRAVLVLALGAALLGSAVSACRLERRADLDENGEGPAATAGGELGGPVADSAVRVVRTAEEVLDGSDDRTLESLLHPDATVLPEPEDAPAPDEWQLLESRVELRGALALVFRRHRAIEDGEAAPMTRAGTWVLVREEGEWRVLHLHRSRGRVGS